MKVNQARGNRDMRPRAVKHKTRKPVVVETSNVFESLTEEDDENEETQPIKALRWVKVNKDADIMSVDVNKPQEIGAVSQVSGTWERIPVKIDSGAIDTVMPPSVGRFFNTIQTEMSQKGPGFRAANGSPIKHYGQRTLKGLGDQFQQLNMTAQVADVKTTLGSVNQMLKAGNVVHFETGNCYIEDTRTGRKTKMEEKGGTFEVGIWVPKATNRGPGDGAEATEETRKPAFHRQDGEF